MKSLKQWLRAPIFCLMVLLSAALCADAEARSAFRDGPAPRGTADAADALLSPHLHVTVIVEGDIAYLRCEMRPMHLALYRDLRVQDALNRPSAPASDAAHHPIEF